MLILIAVVGWLGLALQWLVSVRIAASGGHPGLRGIIDALCYFTVLTNLLVTIIATARLLDAGAARILAARGTLAAAAVYIFVVGLIYSLLLRSLWAPSGLHKMADVTLHDLVPLLYVLWWLCFAPKGGLRWIQTVSWLGYPLAYFGFSVLLGALTGRYLRQPVRRWPHSAPVQSPFAAAAWRSGARWLLLRRGAGLNQPCGERMSLRACSSALRSSALTFASGFSW